MGIKAVNNQNFHSCGSGRNTINDEWEGLNIKIERNLSFRMHVKKGFLHFISPRSITETENLCSNRNDKS